MNAARPCSTRLNWKALVHWANALWHSRVCGCHSQQRARVWTGWTRLVYPLISLLALGWFLYRVIPKPIRATYPCQQAAFPLASSFVIWLLGIKSGLLTWLEVKGWLPKLRTALRPVGLVVLLGLATIAAGQVVRYLSQELASAASWVPSDPPNRPIGVAKGIFPGRVVWIRDTNATPWTGTTGNWWADGTGINQAAVDRMLSRSLRTLAGATTDAEAWDKIFRYFNSTHGRGDVGYRPGEIVAIKINCNNSSSYTDVDNQADASPQAIIALLRQLVNAAGVPQTNIVVYEAPNTAPTRIIPDRIYSRCVAQFPQVTYADCTGTSGRQLIQWQANAITYSVPNDCGRNIPTVVVQATYLINMALLKGHSTAGVTLTAKNHYGSINAREHTYIRARDSGMGSYNPFVDLIGHPHLGGKTLLFMIDGLYGCVNVGSTIDAASARWNNLFNGQWSASFFLSLDPVAIDSVALDFLRAEFGAALGGGNNISANCDNYLHEAALAHNPPSGIVYRPDGSNRLSSLGVHEHWNDAVRKQYSRNLGTGDGIELVAVHQLAGVSVSLTSPTNGTVFEWGAPIPLHASVLTNWAGARQVEFYRGHSLLGSSTQPPFSFVWSNPLPGNWTLRAVATDSDGLRATSAVVNVTVVSARPLAPLILTQPTNQVVMAGETAQLSVEAAAWPAPGYQWLKDGAGLADATWPLLVLSNATPAQSGIYAVTITNAVGAVTSAPAGLAVLLPPVSVTLIPTSAVWRYHDRAQDLGTAWRLPEYDDSSWSVGCAELGFGDGPARPECTVIASNRQWTTYFGHRFVVSNLAGLVSLQAQLLRDDGAVVYLNGTEVFRDNMPSGTVTYSTPASSACSDDGTLWLPATVPVALLRPGTNVLAVEVHQNALSSSDVSFDFGLSAQRVVEPPKLIAHPTSRTCLAGQPTTFRVQAASLLPLSYSWLFAQVPLAGQTNPTLTLPNLRPEHAGLYQAVVSNSVGAVTSAPAALVVVDQLQLEAWAVAGQRFHIRFAGGGQSCTVLVSTNLQDWAVLTNLSPRPGPVEVYDFEMGLWPARFYKVRFEP